MTRSIFFASCVTLSMLTFLGGCSSFSKGVERSAEERTVTGIVKRYDSPKVSLKNCWQIDDGIARYAVVDAGGNKLTEGERVQAKFLVRRDGLTACPEGIPVDLTALKPAPLLP